MHTSPYLQNAIALRTAAKAHAQLVKLIGAFDSVSWNKVLTSYSKSSGLVDACKLFDDIHNRDSVSWNSLIAAHVSSHAYEQSWKLFKSMISYDVAFDQFTFGSLFKSIACARHLVLGSQLHSLVVKSGFHDNVFVASALVDAYAKCGMIQEAYAVFELIPEPNTVSWNAMISGCAQLGNAEIAFKIFNLMERKGVLPDEATFASLLTLINGTTYHKLMSQLHTKIIKYGEKMDIIVYNAAIMAYSQCGSVGESKKVFDKMNCSKDLVTWNSLLAAFSHHCLVQDAVLHFIRMQALEIDPDVYTFTTLISACLGHEHYQNGRALHGLTIKRGLDNAITVSNALIVMYIRSGMHDMIEDAMKCFESMELKDSISWNSILTGLSQNGFCEEALKLFAHMHSFGINVDQYAFSATMRSCADLAVLQLGKQVHCLSIKSAFMSNDFVASSLIYMYSKCGTIVDAKRSFDDTRKNNSITFNSMIFSYAQHGQGQLALDLFTEMQELSVAPDHVTFVGLITACSHTGLVKEGRMFLETMESSYGIPLRMEHYACGVDLFGRAGQLHEAMKFIESMPFEPDASVWMTLLGACRMHHDIELAGHVANHLLVTEPKEHSTYVLLSQMYSSFGMWDDRALIQKAMRNRGLQKVPGWSWIEIKNKVHSFNADDKSHSEMKEIYNILEVLVEEIEVTSSTDPESEFFVFQLAWPAIHLSSQM